LTDRFGEEGSKRLVLVRVRSICCVVDCLCCVHVDRYERVS
jgi:hypothetical protein